MTSVLRATLVIEPRGATARCALLNEGDVPAVVNLAPLTSPSLALEVRDDRNEPVHLPPPPVPPAEVPLAAIGPGERHTATFTGFLPSWVSPGRYRVRFRYVPGRSAGRWVEDDLWSDWVEFDHS